MLAYKRNTQNGFTVTELLITVVISSVLISAAYHTFHSQQQSYLIQSGTAAMQQNLRGSIYLMTRELRSAGYNPTKAITNNIGFVTAFPAPNNLFVVNYTSDHSLVAFTLDTNGNGAIDPNMNEQIAYRFNNLTKTLERFNDTVVNPADKWEAVATNIDALDFVYVDATNNLTTTPADIQYIEVSLLASMRKQDHKYINTDVYTNKRGVDLCPLCVGDHYHRRLLTTTLQIRNQGL